MSHSPYVATTNACKLCTPLGAALAFRGVEDTVPFLHGSQGCATYMRRYSISHFREPMDVASSSLGEKQAVYGGGANMKKGLLNVMKNYKPRLIGAASTCLTETIGEDMAMILEEFREEFGDLELPHVVRVSTPSYSGTHVDGWHGAVRSLAEQLCEEGAGDPADLNLFPGLLSCEDIRHLGDILAGFGLRATVLPDISRTLDGPATAELPPIPPGGTPVEAVRGMGGSGASLELGACLPEVSAGQYLRSRFGVPCHRIGLPIGLRESDVLFRELSRISGRPTPPCREEERGRLVDAYVDGHKYLFGKRAVVFGEADLVAGLVSFLAETGVEVVLAGTGEKSPGLAGAVSAATSGLTRNTPLVRTGVDFEDIAGEMDSLQPDLLVGHSKGYPYARARDIPLIRVGFPIHDRFGGQRTRHVGYAGALDLYDRLVNAVLAVKQADSPVGYGYM